MKLSLAVPLLPLVLLAAAVEPAFSQEEPCRIEDVFLGEQVAGPRLSVHDLTGRVVVLFHWCVSCPLSTGAFPYVNGLLEKYGDRGVAIVGIQVRRIPDVAENDVVFYLEHLKPDFPVTRLGWDPEWPVAYLSWASIFDHEGKEVFRGHINTLEQVLDRTLTGTPDYLVGGPYSHLDDLAERIVADREHTGRHLLKARLLAATKGRDPERRAEAMELLASVTRFFENQVAKAGEDEARPVERARIFADLAAMFAGDDLGEQAREALEVLRADPGFSDEVAAEEALAKSRASYRRMPPPGHYIYHFTDMNYEESDDPVLKTLRYRMIAEHRLELARIFDTWPETEAALAADDLRYRAEMPEIDEEAARVRVERAEKLLRKSPRPYDLMEAYLSLYEVVEGYWEQDDLAERAAEMLAACRKTPRADLAAAAAAHHTLSDEARSLEAEIEAGGSLLPRAKAGKLAARLAKVAAKAGEESALASRVRAYLARLEASYDGPVQLGVAFDQGHEGPGVKLGRIYPGTAAEAAGLKPGDVVLKLAGHEMDGPGALRAALAGCKPGQEVEAVVLRAGAGEPETVQVILGRRQ